MGNPYPEEERDIELIKTLCESHVGLQRYLSHHLRNSLMAIEAGIYKNDMEMVREAKEHIIEDLQKVLL